MFPIPFNFPFRKKDGSISTIGNEIENGGSGGSTYTLPTASANVKGGVKIGDGLTMDGDVLKNTNPTPAEPYTLPTASVNTLGGVKIGSGLSIDEGVLSVSNGSGGSGTTTVTAIELDKTHNSYTATAKGMIIMSVVGNSSGSNYYLGVQINGTTAVGGANGLLLNSSKSAVFNIPVNVGDIVTLTHNYGFMTSIDSTLITS